MTNWDRQAVGRLDKETPLLDIYNNSHYREFRKLQRAGIFRGPCKTCGFAYTGTGFEGVVRFRDKKLIGKEIIAYINVISEDKVIAKSRWSILMTSDIFEPVKIKRTYYD